MAVKVDFTGCGLAPLQALLEAGAVPECYSACLTCTKPGSHLQNRVNWMRCPQHLRLRQGNQKFKASLDYKRPVLRKR